MNDLPPADYCGDGELGYERSRTRFSPGEGLQMDEVYRYAHLPLIAPAHPAVIAAHPAKGYEMGRHAKVYSLVMRVPADALASSESYLALERELRGSPFGHKIAWELLETRRSKLHATICSSLQVGSPPSIEQSVFRALADFGPIRVQLRGLFSGNLNVGRLYIRAYPERRNGQNAFGRIQRVMKRPQTDLYLVGMFNLTDDLDAAETSALSELIGTWWDRPLVELTVDKLCILGSSDDLVLHSEVVETIVIRAAGIRLSCMRPPP